MNATGLYDSHVDALVAAVKAARADCGGIVYGYTRRNHSAERAWMAFVDPDKVERIAGGLELTGYTVTTGRAWPWATVTILGGTL